MTWKIKPQMDVNVSKYTASFKIKWGGWKGKNCTGLLLTSFPNLYKEK